MSKGTKLIRSGRVLELIKELEERLVVIEKLDTSYGEGDYSRGVRDTYELVLLRLNSIVRFDGEGK